MCVDMEHKRIRDNISGAFADLTALLEDAAGMAVEGQSLRCTIKDLENAAALIRAEVDRVTMVLAATARLIAVCPED